jgi:hypothetical protein
MNSVIDNYVIDLIALIRGAEDADIAEIEALVRSRLISFIDDRAVQRKHSKTIVYEGIKRYLDTPGPSMAEIDTGGPYPDAEW